MQQRTSEIARLGNVLQDAGIKIDSVASSIATKSGRAMIEALIDGERRGPVLAELAKGKMRAKIADLSMALEGRFGDHRALMCRLHLDHAGQLEAMIGRLDAQLEAMMAPFRAAGDLLATTPASGSSPPPGLSARSAPTSGNSSPMPRTWPPGPGYARATTNPPASTAPAGAATATSTCSPSWSNVPCQRPATTANSKSLYHRHIGFEPIIRGEPRLMDARIFAAGPMGLKEDLLTIPLEARFAYDAERNIFFLNMEGMSLVSAEDVEAIGTAVGKRLAAIGKKVQMVVNYDNFYLDPALTDDYVSVVRRLAERHYASVTRYTTSSFLRLKLTRQLHHRDLAPHIYESRQEAMNWLEDHVPRSSVQNREGPEAGE